LIIRDHLLLICGLEMAAMEVPANHERIRGRVVAFELFEPRLDLELQTGSIPMSAFEDCVLV